MLDSWLAHHFPAAGVPTNADECLEAVQSDMTGHRASDGIWYMVYVALVSFSGLVPNSFVAKWSIQ